MKMSGYMNNDAEKVPPSYRTSSIVTGETAPNIRSTIPSEERSDPWGAPLDTRSTLSPHNWFNRDSLLHATVEAMVTADPSSPPPFMTSFFSSNELLQQEEVQGGLVSGDSAERSIVLSPIFHGQTPSSYQEQGHVTRERSEHLLDVIDAIESILSEHWEEGEALTSTQEEDHHDSDFAANKTSCASAGETENWLNFSDHRKQ